MSFQPPPPGNPPPPPPGEWPPPPAGGPPPPPPPPSGPVQGEPPPGAPVDPAYGTPPPPAAPPPYGTPPPGPPPPYGTPPPGTPPPGTPPAWGPPPAPPKKSRKGLIIGLGLGAAVLLIVVVVALASVADKVSGRTDLADLRRGDCFNTSRALVADKATRVPCSEPHTDEVAGVLTFPAPKGARYPGQNGILEFGKQDCQQQVSEFYGDKEPSETTQVYVFGPNEPAWKNGDRAVVCSLREQSAAKRTGSYLDG